MVLYDRSVALTVDTLRITGLKISFEIEKNLKKKPNIFSCSVYNLSEDSRAALQHLKSRVVLEAGYGGQMAVIAAGDSQSVTSEQQGVDIITKIQAGDSARAITEARTKCSFASGASLAQAMERLIHDLGVGPGNAMKRIAQARSEGRWLDNFSAGLACCESTSKAITRVLSGADLYWTVTDGQMDVWGGQECRAEGMVLLNADSGLVGAPSIGKAKSVTFKSLLQGNILPRRLVKIESKFFNGTVRVRTVKHRGDTHGDEWVSECEGKVQGG